MHGDFSRRQGKDQPAVAHVDVRESKHVTKERAIGFGVGAVEDRVCAGDLRHRPPVYARPANSRVSVWTLTFSPSLMKRGTRISNPVSSVAAFVTVPLAVSPRTAG